MPTPESLTIPDKLDSINVTKQAIRQAIVDKGVEVPEGGNDFWALEEAE